MITGFSKKPIHYDTGIVRDQLYALRLLYRALGPAGFCRSFIWILRKEPDSKEEKIFLRKRYGHWNKKLVPFVWNKMQIELNDNISQNNIVLKFRQGGSTTWFIIMRLLLPSILEHGSSGLLISQTKNYGAKHFEILKRAYRHFGKRDPFDDSRNGYSQLLHQHLLHLQASNRHELIFDALDSRILVDTAEKPEVGQGLPGVNHLVGTELSRWPGNPKETWDNASESVTPHGTKDHEWTANGLGGYGFEEYQKAKSGNSIYRAHFYPWPYADEYTLEGSDEIETWVENEKDYTEVERNLAKAFDLTLGQIAWRRAKMVALGEDFYEKYPEDDQSCFLLVGGRPFFERGEVRERYLYCQANVKPIDVSDNGAFTIYRKVVAGRRYIIHADVAEGKTETTTEPDFSAFTVIDEIDGYEMASYRDRLPPDAYAMVLQNIAMLYNNALVSVENNPGGGGETTLYVLQNQLAYWNLYKHRFWYKPKSEKAKIVETLGLPTTPKTRPIMLNMLAQVVRESPELFVDKVFWQECSTFVCNEKGRPGAAEGCYDDTVLARAGAVYVRRVQIGDYDPLSAVSEGYGERPERAVL